MDNQNKRSTLELNMANRRKALELEVFARQQTMSTQRNVGSTMVYGHDQPNYLLEITKNIRNRASAEAI